MTIENHSGEIHPMHLHGHHAVVLSRNGTPALRQPVAGRLTDVASGDSSRSPSSLTIPASGWDHRHNLPHATEGLVAHVATPASARRS